MDGHDAGTGKSFMRRFLIDHKADCPGKARLEGLEAHHARNVLRLSTGDMVEVIDGQGFEYHCRIKAMHPDRVELDILAPKEAAAESELDFTLGLGLLKSDKMELVVQKGTELGLSGLVPIRAARSTVKLDEDRGKKRIERWKNISRQALKQCRRGRPVDIKPASDLKTFIASAENADLKIVLHITNLNHGNNWAQALSGFPRPRRVFGLVGPEGGFTEEEITMAVEAGFLVLGMGPRIMRAETAALALIAVLGFELGDLTNFT